MKKLLKYTGITFAVLIALGIIGNMLGVESVQQQVDETTEASREITKLVEEQAAVIEEQNELLEKQAEQVEEAEKLAEEQAKAAEEAAKQVEKEAAQAAKEAEKLAAEQAKAEEEAKKLAEKEAEEAAKQVSSWEAKINELVSNSLSPNEKFYELEEFAYSYKYDQAEVETFASDIIADYTSGAYLSDIANDKRMLTNIFKGYIVEKASAGAIKDFAFDYYQNIKYTYRGVDAVDSEAVKSNERQMDKALAEI